jgi:voltage-gated potassium channel Kch
VTTLDERRLWSRVAAVCWRSLFPVTALLSAVLGYRGMGSLLEVHRDFADDQWDRIYYTLQLFVLGSPPLDDGGPLSPSLQIARFLAPAVTVYAVLETIRLLFAAEVTRLRARRSRGHVIVCGSSLVADALTTRLAEDGRRVVRVARPPERAGGRRGLLFVPGDSTNASLLRGAGVRRAGELYVCSTDTAWNLSVVLAAADLDRKTPLRVNVQVDDPELCLALQARRLGGHEDDKMIVNFFNWHERAALTLLAARQPPLHADRPTRVMVVGASWFGRALIVELARLWRVRSAARKLEVIVVDASAWEAVHRLRRLYPFVGEVCHLETRNRNVATMLDGDLTDLPPDRVYICCDDEEVGLKLALTMDHFWRGGPRSVIVRLGQLGGLARAFYGPGERLLDPVSGTLDMFDALRAGTDVTLTEDSLTERLARAIHDRYLRQQLDAGVVLGSTPAMHEWPDLSDGIRGGNRAQAADIGPKLSDVGCSLAPNPIWGDPKILTPEMIEQLARREHLRWCESKVKAGWRYAAQRDEVNLLHPDLIDWEDLSELEREKNHDAVRQLPELLADVGFRIVRVRERPAVIPRPRQGGSSLDLSSLLD